MRRTCGNRDGNDCRHGRDRDNEDDDRQCTDVHHSQECSGGGQGNPDRDDDRGRRRRHQEEGEDQKESERYQCQGSNLRGDAVTIGWVGMMQIKKSLD